MVGERGLSGLGTKIFPGKSAVLLGVHGEKTLDASGDLEASAVRFLRGRLGVACLEWESDVGSPTPVEPGPVGGEM